MSNFFTPRNLLIAGGIGSAIFLFPRTRRDANPVGNVFETPGTKNVGERYAAQGGTETHMPGVATPRGSVEKQAPPQTQLQGTTSGKFQDRVADQKQDTNPVGAALGKATLGSAHDHEAHGTTAAKLIKNAAPCSPVEASKVFSPEEQHPGTEELHHTQNGGEKHVSNSKGKEKHRKTDKASEGKHDESAQK